MLTGASNLARVRARLHAAAEKAKHTLRYVRVLFMYVRVCVLIRAWLCNFQEIYLRAPAKKKGGSKIHSKVCACLLFDCLCVYAYACSFVRAWVCNFQEIYTFARLHLAAEKAKHTLS